MQNLDLWESKYLSVKIKNVQGKFTWLHDHEAVLDLYQTLFIYRLKLNTSIENAKNF